MGDEKGATGVFSITHPSLPITRRRVAEKPAVASAQQISAKYV
jgi:hypothetical protein